AAAGGCRMCASPYDYCGPVVECGDNHPSEYSAQPAASGSDYETVPAPAAKPETPTPAIPPAPKPELQPQAGRRSGTRQTTAKLVYPYGDRNDGSSASGQAPGYQR